MANNSRRVGLGTGKGRGYKNLVPYDEHVHYLAGKGVTIYQPVFSKQKLTHLPLELTLFVPSTIGDKPITKAQFNKRVGEAETKMRDLFGGYTKTNSDGGWVDKKGEPIDEPVATVSSFTTIEDFEKNKAEFEDYVKGIQKKYEQDAISIEFEGDLFFYGASKKQSAPKGWKVNIEEKGEYLWEHDGLYASVVEVKSMDGKDYVFQVFDTKNNKRIIKQTVSSESKALKTARDYMKNKSAELIEGGMSSGMSNSDFNKKQLAMGVKVEMEHTTNPKIAKEITRDHLAEIPDYYTRLAKMEKEIKR